jgi:hypothetical protein
MLDQPQLDRRARPQVERLEAEAVNSAKVRQPLYAARKKIFPKRASGAFRRFKWQVMLVTLAIYYLTPWIRWDRGVHAPDQAVLVDIASRRFYFFFIEIWPQEFFFVAGLLVMAGIGLFLVTSTVGRAWCGYACPQTVWVDLFLVIERAVEGDRSARMRLDAAPGRPARSPSARSSMASGFSSRSPPAAPGSSISPMPRRSRWTS